MSKRWTVVLTRTQEDNQEITPLFEEFGMQVISLPMIAIQDIPFTVEQLPEEITSALVLLTSRKGTERWLRLHHENEFIGRIAVEGYLVVGKRSEEMLRSAGKGAQILVVAESGRELVKRVGEEGRQEEGEIRRGEEVLYPCSKVRRDEVLEGLSEIGYRVVDLPLYEPVLPEKSKEELLVALKTLDEQFIVAFFSPSAVQNFFSVWVGDRATLQCIAIGQTTAAALENQGVANVILPEHPDVSSLIQSLIANY